MKVLGVVPARSGSKGFKDKNIAKVNELTLIEHAVHFGLSCGEIDDVYISTDSNKYLKIALKAGAKSLGLRPFHLALDEAKSVDVVIDLINSLEKKYDYN